MVNETKVFNSSQTAEDSKESIRIKKEREEIERYFDSIKDEIIETSEFKGKTQGEINAEMKKIAEAKISEYDFSKGISYGTIEKLICSDDWKKIDKGMLEFYLVNYIHDWYDSRSHIFEIAKCIKNEKNIIPEDFNVLLFECLWFEHDIDLSEVIIKILVLAFGAEIVRKKIEEDLGESWKANLEYSNNDNEKKLISEELYLRSIITPFEKKEFIGNLKKFYEEKIKFEDYGLNKEMNKKEVELLKSLIGKDEKVLEEGCGTGRLFLEMKKAGYDISGFDFADHIKKVKEKDHGADVFEGDWHQTGLKDEGFDTVYSLGRNILHDYSIIDQVQTFREANRILKKSGKFIFDIPDRKKGSYKMMVEEYALEMKKRGIKNFRYGSIYDSPDGVNFATRYAYSEEDIQELANLTGFKIEDVIRKELKTGKGDENIYYVLEKI